jgi:orotate phosphoribosyltransferase
MDPNITVAECRGLLAETIKAKALRFGEFVLASGQTSSYYIDGRLVTLDPVGAYCLARCLLDMIPEDVDAVGGMAIGADPITGAVVALAGEAGRPLLGFMVRKEPKGHGTGKQVEGPVPEGARVVMLEDTITTGGSTLKAIEALEREKGAEVVKVICMVDRQQGAAEALAAAGYELQAVFKIEELGVQV